jgi:hypothetical protein
VGQGTGAGRCENEGLRVEWRDSMSKERGRGVLGDGVMGEEKPEGKGERV